MQAQWRSRGRWIPIANVLLVLFVALFGVAVLAPVVTEIERRSRFSRGACSLVLVLGIMLLAGVVLLVVVPHARDITGSVGTVSAGVAHVGVT